MDIDEIRELVRLMVDNDLAELDVTDGESKIRLRRGSGGEVVAVPTAANAPPPAAAVAAEAAEPVADLIEVRSPIVGTFYAAADPESEPYVSVGSAVGADSVVCIIEAMKVMNEIKAEQAGEIVDICVKNAQPVEYGQVLFRLRVS